MIAVSDNGFELQLMNKEKKIGIQVSGFGGGQLRIELRNWASAKKNTELELTNWVFPKKVITELGFAWKIRIGVLRNCDLPEIPTFGCIIGYFLNLNLLNTQLFSLAPSALASHYIYTPLAADARKNQGIRAPIHLTLCSVGCSAVVLEPSFVRLTAKWNPSLPFKVQHLQQCV